MKRRTNIIRLIALSSALACLSSSSAWAEDNTTLFINGFTTNAGGSFILGNLGTNNFLIITNSGVLIATNSTMGVNTSADDNVAIVTGVGSQWTNTGNLTVGNLGANNDLFIANG